MTAPAVFEFFVRRLPAGRGFLLACGLETVLRFLEEAALGEDELAWLQSSGRFSAATLERLRAFRFTGDVEAMAEGTVCFGGEPLLRVTAPLPEAQLLETRIINLLHYQTLVASKAARMVLAAPGKLLLDFGLRRAHGAEAGLLAARAAYVAGFAGTATTLALPVFGIPITGTMAHSFIQAHGDETLAFERFARTRPDQVVLLLDTYDTEAAARKVAALAPRLAADGITVRGVRLDSGDLARHARAVRAILDAAGLASVQIFASGGLDEDRLRRLTAEAAPIDGYGIGTSLATSSDCPALDCAYKLQEYDGRPTRKRSEAKATWPGRKQVLRRYDDAGRMAGDLIARADEAAPGEPLLRPAMRAGARLTRAATLDDIRAHARRELARLPAHLAALADDPPYPVEVSAGLVALAEEADRAVAAAAARPGR
jgi:nicotinate phosphoribosyltransferase